LPCVLKTPESAAPLKCLAAIGSIRGVGDSNELQQLSNRSQGDRLRCDWQTVVPCFTTVSSSQDGQLTRCLGDELRPQAVPEARFNRTARLVLIAGAVLTVGGYAAARLAGIEEWGQFFDGVHRTASSFAAAIVAWLGVAGRRRARGSRALFAKVSSWCFSDKVICTALLFAREICSARGELSDDDPLWVRLLDRLGDES
jgi:hypothetical protein